MTRYRLFSSIILGAFCFFILTQSTGFTYELSEVDGDDVSGNAPILLGWHESELPLQWAVVEGNGPGTPVTTAAFISAVENSFAAWDNLVTSKVSFEKANGNGVTDGILPLSPPVTSTSFSPIRSLSGRMGPPADDGINNVVYCVTNGWGEDYGFSSSALAVTIFAFSTKTRLIAGGDIFLNCDGISGMWDIVDPANPDNSKYDVQNTITHEIGHFIGLGHPYADGRELSTMYYSASAGETTKRELSQDDINGANYLYPEPGVLLIPPDTNKDGLKDLSNPNPSGGCSVQPQLLANYENGFQTADPISGILSYSLLLFFLWKIGRRSRALTSC